MTPGQLLSGGAHPSTKIFLELIAINNNILEEEPCSRSTIFTSCDESQRPRPQGSGGSSPEQKEDNNLGQVRRPFGLSKEGLRAKGGEEEGGQNWRIQSNFFIVKASCVSE